MDQRLEQILYRQQLSSQLGKRPPTCWEYDSSPQNCNGNQFLTVLSTRRHGSHQTKLVAATFKKTNKNKVVLHAIGSTTMEFLPKRPYRCKKFARFKGDKYIKERSTGDYQLNNLQRIENIPQDESSWRLGSVLTKQYHAHCLYSSVSTHLQKLLGRTLI